jgi:hypothetical protein
MSILAIIEISKAIYRCISLLYLFISFSLSSTSFLPFSASKGSPPLTPAY